MIKCIRVTKCVNTNYSSIHFPIYVRFVSSLVIMRRITRICVFDLTVNHMIDKPFLSYLQISRIEMFMPNKHYLTVDMSKFPPSVLENNENKEVYHPIDKPSGIIYAELLRKELNSKL